MHRWSLTVDQAERGHAHRLRRRLPRLAADGKESGLMRVMGWRSPQMLRGYGE